MKSTESLNIVINHMVWLTKLSCVFCATQELESGRSRLYLISEDHERIFARNGLNDSWVELNQTDEYFQIRRKFLLAMNDHKVPRFHSEDLDIQFSL